MSDFETSVGEAHHALVKAGHSWAQPRALTEAEKFDAVKLPVEWISAPKPVIDQRTVQIRRLDLLAVRFVSLSMMTRVTKPRPTQPSGLASDPP